MFLTSSISNLQIFGDVLQDLFRLLGMSLQIWRLCASCGLPAAFGRPPLSFELAESAWYPLFQPLNPSQL